MAYEWVDSLITLLPWILGIVAGWIAGNAVLKKALTLTLDTFDSVTDVVAQAKTMREDVMKALEDKNVSEEEYAVLMKDYDNFMREADELSDNAKYMIEAYRELFGVIINVFRKKF